MRFARAHLAGLGLGLVACGSARHQESPACVSCSSAAAVAGGETSEFSGGDGFCPEERSVTEIDLADPALAPWLALASGHRELSLRWTPTLPDGAVRGYQPETSLSLDATVLRGQDVVFGAAGPQSYESADCDGSSERRFQVAIELATGDGALVGSFRQWLRPTVDPLLRTRSLTPTSAPLSSPEQGPDFAGTLELGPEAAASDLRWQVRLEFDSDSARGSLTPLLAVPNADRSLPVAEQPSWSPIIGKFPDDGCAQGYAVPLDEADPLLGDVPRAVYERARARWQDRVLPAFWGPAQGAPGAILVPTEVTVSAGAPVVACKVSGTVDVQAPLHVASADGRVSVESAAQIGLARAENDARIFYVNASAQTDWSAAAEFAQSTGLHDVDLRGADYGALAISHADDPRDDEIRGELQVSQWQGFLPGPAPYPVLRWCTGPSCELRRCVLTTDFPDRDCARLLQP